MILKKPYAFLIKHFRIIHLLLLIPMGYLIYKTNDIVSFFRSYVNNNYTTDIIDIAGEYINIFMYLAVILILVVLFAIYYLMKKKDKSTKLYVSSLIYYLIIFLLIGISHSIMSNMSYNVIEAQTARAYRDIANIIVLPQYFFILYTLIRGIGFDIKKFNFASDIKELEIKDVDSEEFEFALSVPGYKIERGIRRFIREFIYYVKENIFIFSIILSFVVIFIGTSLYLNFAVYNKTYTVTDKMVHNYFNIEITDSIVTNMGYDGNIISEGKYFLVLQLYIENKSTSDQELDYTNFRLVIDNENYYPTLDRGGYFIDMGINYAGEEIKGGSSNYYVLVYEIPQDKLQNSYTIKILESVNYKKGELSSQYKNIVLSPEVIDEIIEEENLTIGKTINFKNSFLGYSTLKIDGYDISNTYTYSYNYCYSTSNCTTLKDMISTSVASKVESTVLLILNGEYSIDSTTIYGSNLKLDSKFLNQFLSVRYTKDGVSKIISLDNKTTTNMSNTIVFETKSEISSADSIELLITLREHRYIYKLK